MATWHQLKAGRLALTPEDGICVVEDPPNQLRTVTSNFHNRVEAQAYIDRCEGFRPGSKRYMWIWEPYTRTG